MTVLGEEDFGLAGEYVLGLLGAADEASTSARIATDGDFAAEVEAWRQRLQPLIDGNDTTAPEYIWNAVSAALPLPTAQDVGKAGLRVWQGLTGLALSIAAVLGILLLQQPEVVTTPTPQAPLVAALGSDTGNASITARYDADNGRMLLTPVSLDTGELYPELWIIPADGTPRSLGIVRGDAASEITITAEMRNFMSKGGTLAITPELRTGSADGKPSGPIIASGKITTV